MMAYEHGGDIYTNPVQMDFSVNLSPLGIPDEVRTAYLMAIDDLGRYPDEEGRSLRKAASAFFARAGIPVPPECFLFGSGAAELIYDIFRAVRPERVILPAPTFSEYGKAARAAGAEVLEISMAEPGTSENGSGEAPGGSGKAAAETGPSGFSHRAFLNRLRGQRIPGGRTVLVLCHPSNPTGLAMTREEIREAAALARERNWLLLADECFLWFVERERRAGFLGAASEFPGLIAVNAVTKACAVPGLRAGFAVAADPGIRESIRSCRQPWSLSIPAERAMAAAFALEGLSDRIADACAGEREVLRAGLTACGFTVFPSDANFLLFRKAAGDPRDYRELLLGRGILIRSCANFSGLGERYYRIAVKTGEENLRLLAAFREAVES